MNDAEKLQQLELELYQLRAEKHKAWLKERQIARRELIRNMGIVSKKFFAPQPPKTKTPIALERIENRKKKARRREQMRKLQVSVFTAKQLRLAEEILERMEDPK